MSNKLHAFLSSSPLEKIMIFWAFILPPLILYFIPVTNVSLIWVLGGLTTTATAIYLNLTKTSVVALGLKMKWDSVVAILPGTLYLAVVGLLLFAIIPWLYGQPRSLYFDIDYIWYFYITLFQEIIWRGLAFLLLDKIFLCSHQKILISAILFAFMHIYFKSILVIAGSLILGIHWGRNYNQYRSLLGISISHYFLGMSLIVLNYMGIKTSWSWF